MRPVQPSVQMQLKPVGSSTQVAPFMHGDDKHACSTEGMTETGEVEGSDTGEKNNEDR